MPDDAEGDVLAIAGALGYQWPATFAVARAECHEQVRLVAREGDAGDGDWIVAVLSRLPVLDAGTVPLPPQLPATPAPGAGAGRRRRERPAVHRARHPPAAAQGPRVAAGPRPAGRAPGPDEPGALAGDMNMWGWCADRLAAAAAGGGPSGAAPTRPTVPTARPTTSWSTRRLGRGRPGWCAQVLSDHRPVRAPPALLTPGPGSSPPAAGRRGRWPPG